MNESTNSTALGSYEHDEGNGHGPPTPRPRIGKANAGPAVERVAPLPHVATQLTPDRAASARPEGGAQNDESAGPDAPIARRPGVGLQCSVIRPNIGVLGTGRRRDRTPILPGRCPG